MPEPDAEFTDPLDQADQADESYQAAADLDRQDLKMISALAAMLPELRALNTEDCSGMDDRVQAARDKALIAVCDRLRRIARRDIPFG
jgi:hypothetical protein